MIRRSLSDRYAATVRDTTVLARAMTTGEVAAGWGGLLHAKRSPASRRLLDRWALELDSAACATWGLLVRSRVHGGW